LGVFYEWGFSLIFCWLVGYMLVGSVVSFMSYNLCSMSGGGRFSFWLATGVFALCVAITLVFGYMMWS